MEDTNLLTNNYKVIVSTIVENLIKGDIVPFDSKHLEGKSLNEVLELVFRYTKPDVCNDILFKRIKVDALEGENTYKFGMLLSEKLTNYINSDLAIIEKVTIDNMIDINPNDIHFEYDTETNKRYLFINSNKLGEEDNFINLDIFEHHQISIIYKYLDLETIDSDNEGIINE